MTYFQMRPHSEVFRVKTSTSLLGGHNSTHNDMQFKNSNNSGLLGMMASQLSVIMGIHHLRVAAGAEKYCSCCSVDMNLGVGFWHGWFLHIPLASHFALKGSLVTSLYVSSGSVVTYIRSSCLTTASPTSPTSCI